MGGRCHSPQCAPSPAQPHTGSTHSSSITQCSRHGTAWVQRRHPPAQPGWSQVGADPQAGPGAALGAAGHRWGWVALCQDRGQDGQRAWECSGEAWYRRQAGDNQQCPLQESWGGCHWLSPGSGKLLPTPPCDATSLRLL